MLVRYKSRDYVFIQRKVTRYGATVQLSFLDGSKAFWVQEQKTKPNLQKKDEYQEIRNQP